MCGLRIVKYRTRLLQSVIGALILIGAASVAAEENLKAALQIRYNAMKVAMAAHDDSAIKALLAPDFKSIDVSGESKTASQMIAVVKDLKTDPNKISVTTLASVSVVGSIATVEQQYDMKTLQIGIDGVAHPFKLVALSTDTWVKLGDAWLWQQTVTNEMTLFTDDKLLMHKVKP